MFCAGSYLVDKSCEKQSHCGLSFAKCKIKMPLRRARSANNCLVHTANSFLIPLVKAKLESKKTFVVGQTKQNLEFAHHPVQD